MDISSVLSAEKSRLLLEVWLPWTLLGSTMILAVTALLPNLTCSFIHSLLPFCVFGTYMPPRRQHGWSASPSLATKTSGKTGGQRRDAVIGLCRKLLRDTAGPPGAHRRDVKPHLMGEEKGDFKYSASKKYFSTTIIWMQCDSTLVSIWISSSFIKNDVIKTTIHYLFQ